MVAKDGVHFSVLTIGMPLGVVYSITMLTNLHVRTTLRARLDTPSLFELIISSVKKRVWQNAGDPRSEERPHSTRINIPTGVVTDDVDMKPMNSGTKVQFAVVQNPVLEGT